MQNIDPENDSSKWAIRLNQAILTLRLQASPLDKYATNLNEEALKGRIDL